LAASTLFPYPTLFRSLVVDRGVGVEPAVRGDDDAFGRAGDQGEVLGGVAGGPRQLDRRRQHAAVALGVLPVRAAVDRPVVVDRGDRKSTRLNSSHQII